LTFGVNGGVITIHKINKANQTPLDRPKWHSDNAASSQRLESKMKR
jgi:hypothetical protein